MIISGPLIHLIFLFYWFGIGDKNLNSVVSANVFSYAICFIFGVLFWFSRKESQFNSPNYPIKEILASSIPLLITQIFAQINSLSGEILTGALSEPSQVAFFSIANKIATITAFVLIAVNRAVSAKYASLYSDGNIIELQSVVTTSSRIMLIGGGGLILLIFVFSNSLLNVFGEEFLQAKGVLFVLLFAQLINILTGSVSYLLSMTGHEKIQTKIVMMSSLTMVVLSLLLIPKLGAIGASFSLLFSMTMNNFLGWYYVREIVGINTLKIF
ncbi:polysaccharide biosynthesis C-terminal domain-containing protein [Vibrio parahaemolyticus]|nr:polysaccharide biosynthesis C-terminal domain-containing protein [Vibrio parahaemolyticus]